MATILMNMNGNSPAEIIHWKFTPHGAASQRSRAPRSAWPTAEKPNLHDDFMASHGSNAGSNGGFFIPSGYD